MEKDCEACLGELFSAQKIKVEAYEEQLALSEEMIEALQKSSDDAIGFLKDLKKPPFWSGTYRERILQFLKDRGI